MLFRAQSKVRLKQARNERRAVLGMHFYVHEEDPKFQNTLTVKV
jgi:hypothetical protein